MYSALTISDKNAKEVECLCQEANPGTQWSEAGDLTNTSKSHTGGVDHFARQFITCTLLYSSEDLDHTVY